MSEFVERLLHPGPVLLMMEIVIGLLILATIVIFALRRAKSGVVDSNLVARLKSWWVMVGLFLLAISVHPTLTIILVAVLSYLALKEYFSLVHLRIADRRAMLLAYVAIIVQYHWVYKPWYEMFLIFIPVYMFLIISFRLVLAGETQRFVTSAGKIHWGLMAFVFGLSHLAMFLTLPDREGFAAGPQGLIFYVVFLAEFNDVLQYVFGRRFGKHQLAPRISPKKTWEGFLGGLICTTPLAALLRFLTPMDWQHALVAGFLIAVLGPVGDLVMSAIKRDVGVKDSGSLIPGHGGILDRVDSLCFTVPVFFHFTYFLYY
jgi:phosphatidate cytidylyltransferase